MMHEYRTYTLHPHLFKRYCGLAETKAIPIRKDDYGRLMAFWSSASGTMCQVHHIWEYPDVNERNAERARMVQNAEWMGEFIADAWPTMMRQDIRFMYPVTEFQAPTGSNIYETRIYRAAVGQFRQVADLVAQRPRPQGATLVGCYTSESPDPNDVVEIVAYADIAQRFAFDADDQAWFATHGDKLVDTSSTMLRPLPMSPVK